MRNVLAGANPAADRPILATALVRSAEVESSLFNALANEPGVELRASHVEDPDLAAFRGLRGDVLILDVDPSSRQEMALLSDFVASGTGAPVVVTAPWLDVNSMCALMRIGVQHIVPQPLDRTELLGAIERALSRRQETAVAALERPRGLVVSCVGSCGGVGTTSLAVQAASAMARRGAAPSVSLIDLNLQFGCAALFLDADSPGSIIDLIQDTGRLDGALLRGAMVQTPRGKFDLLGAPPGLVGMDDLDPEAIAAVIEMASTEYALTILDMPLLWSHWTHAALRASDHIVLVVQPTVPSLRQGRRQIERLHQEELDDIPLTVVANRVDRGMFHAGSLSEKQMETALGRKVDYLLPDSPAMRAAAESGQPLGEVRGGRPLERRIAAVFEGFLRGREPAAVVTARPPFRLPFWSGGLGPAMALSR